MAEYIKHTCKDCIHFKICNDYVHLVGREDKIACPDFKSTEDVVPISEVERYKTMCQCYHKMFEKIQEERCLEINNAQTELREEYNFYYTYKGDIDFANNEELLEKIEKSIKEKETSMKYRKKPVTVEAIQWNGFNLEEVKNFVGNSLIYEIFDSAWQVGIAPPKVEMKIKTLEGEMLVSKNDYIIKGIKGEFYPCKPDIFDKTYEQVENEPQTNFDKITESVEKLAEVMDNYYWCPYFCNSTCDSEIECKECIKEWLEQESKEWNI